MTKEWPRVRLGEVLRHRKEFIQIDDLENYRRPRVQLHAQGLLLRDEVPGALIKTKRHQVCRVGELLVAEIDAKVGGFGIVPPTLEGAIVSSHYFLYTLLEDRLDTRFLAYFLSTPGFRDQVEPQGSTNYAAIRPNDVLTYKIPLPTLSMQQEVVARLDTLARWAEAARERRAEASGDAEGLVSRAIDRLIGAGPWPVVPLGQLLAEPPRNGLSPQSAADRGRPMLRINAVSSSHSRHVDTTAIKLVEVPDEIAAPFVARAGDIFLVRYNGDLNRVGKAAMFTGPDPSDIVYPDKLIRVRVDRAVLRPEYLVLALGTSDARRQIESFGRTTAGNIGVNGSNVRSLEIVVPPLGEQRRIVAEVEALEIQVNQLRRLQSITAAAVDALLPAVLDRAFRGELV